MLPLTRTRGLIFRWASGASSSSSNTLARAASAAVGLCAAPTMSSARRDFDPSAANAPTVSGQQSNWQLRRRASLSASRLRNELSLPALHTRPQAERAAAGVGATTALVERADAAPFNGLFSIHSAGINAGEPDTGRMLQVGAFADRRAIKPRHPSSSWDCGWRSAAKRDCGMGQGGGV